MIVFGSGTLAFINKNRTVTDGTSYFRVIAPSLYARFYRRKPGKNYIAGDYVLFRDIIIFFLQRKDKYRFRYFKINESFNKETFTEI